MNQFKKQLGFALPLAILIVVVLIAAGGVGYYFHKTSVEKAEPLVTEEKIEEEEEILEETEAPVGEEISQEEVVPEETVPEEKIEEAPKIEEEPKEEPEEDKLDTLLPIIESYPKLKQVFVDLYGPEFTQEEVEFMKIALNIYKEKPELKNYPEEALYYFAFRFSDQTVVEVDPFAYDNEFFDQTIRQTAKSLKKENNIETAKNIYRWVNNYLADKHLIDIDISLNDYDLKAIWEYRVGKCLEKAHLITALLKSIGIPTREVSSDQILHRWSEIYVDGAWIPIDSTGALDSDNDGSVDFRRLTEDAVIRPDLTAAIQQRDIYFGKKGPYPYPLKFIGYKYSTYWAQQILKLAEYNKFVSLSEEYISKWENSRDWKEREEFGKKALSYAIASVFGEEKSMYVSEQIADQPFFSIKVGSVILDNASSAILEKGLAANRWSYNPQVSTVLSVLLNEHANKEINLIFIDKESGEVIILYPNDIKTLAAVARDFDAKVSSASILEDFVDFITNLQNNKIKETIFALPKLDYEIFISGGAIITGEEGYLYNPLIIAYEEVGNLEFRFQKEDFRSPNPRFKNIKFLNEKGEQLIPLTDKGYFKTCFTEKLKIPFDQSLSLKKDGDYVIIQGRMWIEE